MLAGHALRHHAKAPKTAPHTEDKRHVFPSLLGVTQTKDGRLPRVANNDMSTPNVHSNRRFVAAAVERGPG
jgi:hypothetical protein